MSKSPLRIRANALGFAVLALIASAASATDVLTLPLADARNGSDFGPVWSGIDSAPQQAVWIWRPPSSNDPIDANGNAIPDSCECTADLDGDGTVSASDLATLIGAWGTSGLGDLDGDGAVGSADLGLLLGMWGTC